MYRPPDQDINKFNTFIESILTKATKNQKIIYLMGDFNINLLNEDFHAPTNDFLNVLYSYSLYPSITKPTRITSKSSTLIDNIFTNSMSKQTSGIIMTDLSDHLPIFSFTDLNVSCNTNLDNDVEIRQYTNQNIEYFKSELKSVDWEKLCILDDVDESYCNFITKFKELHDKYIPLKKKRIQSKKKTPNSPWISFALLKCIKRKNLLYKKSLKNPTDANVDKYKKYRNKLNCTLRLAKKNYFSNLLEKEKNNMRNTWKVINSIIRPKTIKHTEKFTLGNKTMTCPKQIATEFNRYFANIGPKLASSIHHKGKDFSSYLGLSNISN